MIRLSHRESKYPEVEKRMKARRSKITHIVFSLGLVFFTSFPVSGKYSGGSGTNDDPYEIATAEDLILLGENLEDYDKHFILTADIDLDPNLPGGKLFNKAIVAPDTDDTKKWFQGKRFNGAFDGNGHVINNLRIQGSEYLGLFGSLGSRAEISNLSVTDAAIQGTGDRLACIVGYNGGSIVTSCSSGTVSSTGSDGAGFGCLAGSNSGSIVASYSKGTVNGNRSVGGLVGANYGSIASTYSTSTASGSSYVGGLVGYNYRGSIATSYSTSKVTGSEDIGGLVGHNRDGRIVASFWDVEISGQDTSAGGVGLISAEMQEIDTFLNAGWDIVEEVFNGTSDYWQISANDYPRLLYETGKRPVATEGSGTVENPYLIQDFRDLGSIWLRPAAHYRLETSLDLSGIKWAIAVVPWFKGSFDGNGHTIINLDIRGSKYLGLFGQLVSGATISDVGLEAVRIEGTGEYVGALVGRTGSLEGKGAIIANCYSTGIVTGESRVGGLVGDNNFGCIKSSHSTCKVEAEYDVGGLVGSHGGSDAISGGILVNCYSTGMVDGKISVGGLVGQNGGFIIGSCSTGAVTGSNAVGGLVGRYVFGRITNSYSSGKVNGNDLVGGLVGDNNYGSIIMCYSSSEAIGTENVGGLVGSNDYSTISACFWDIETSGISTMCGRLSGTKCDDTWGKTTAQMQDINTYISAGWDFVDEKLNGTCDYWQISTGGYPELYHHAGKEPVIQKGLGTIEDPFQIRDITDLSTVWLDPSAHYRFETSLDLSGTVWSMAVVPWFEGTLDGNGHVISNLRIQGSEYLGLFGQLGIGAEIYDLGLENMDVNGLGAYIGCFAGSNVGANISRCHSDGIVTGRGSVGGLVGKNYKGSINQSFSAATVNGYGWVGGLVGDNGDSIISSYSLGSITGVTSVGSLVGRNLRRGSIVMSYGAGTVSGNKETGGLVGFNDGSITSSFWDIDNSGQNTSSGGIGIRTAEMQTARTFLEAGWDFMDETANGTEDTWWIDEGQDYPRLWWELISVN